MHNRFHAASHQDRTRALITIALWFIVALLLATSDLQAYSTGDNLTIGVTTEGRVNQVQFGSQTIDFCYGLDGGFYVRDYTPDASGLPEARGSNNLLDCPDFVTNCLEQWERHGTGSSWSIEHATLQLNGSTTGVAKLSFDEDDPPPHDAWMYQDIDIGPGTAFANPTEHELFCFAFDVATECGFRPKDNPVGYVSSVHGLHRIEGNVWWYDSTPPPLSMTPEEAAALAIGKTDFDVTGTTNSNVPADPPDPAYVVMTSNGVRSYRPLEATWVRVGVRVKGFIPNDGPNDNAVYFDNFAFYKAPPISPVKASGLLGGGTTLVELKDLNGNSLEPRLDGWATITEVDQGAKHYLLVEGELCNQDLIDDRPRAIDLGFALPVEVEVNAQKVEWWDDISHSEFIHDAEQLLPFRMAGEIDARPDRNNEYTGYSKELTRVRAESTQISAYPFSAIDIHRGTAQFGLSLGDNLDSDCVNISHFGYRVLQPFKPGLPYTPFLGLYYVEFRIGIREEASGDNITPFSFIIFRSDNSEWKETSSFREAAEEYEVDIFPEFFSRPTFTSDPWLFGGGILNPDYTVVPGQGTQPAYLDFDMDGFDDQPSDFGFRYMTKRYDAVLSPSLYQQLINWYGPLGVGVAIYNQPWRSGFRNATASDMNMYECGVGCGLVNKRDAFDPTASPWNWGQIWNPIYTASKANHLTLPGGVDLFSDQINDYDTTINDREYYLYPVLLANLDTLLGDDLVDAVTNYIQTAYSGAGDATAYGLRGAEFNNVFTGISCANHLDLTEDRFGAFTNYTGVSTPRRGILTYSINSLSPAISQLATNVWFLDEVRSTLTAIDASAPFGDGLRNPPLTTNEEDEVIMGNMMEEDYGGVKFGIMYADVEGFESNVSTDYNTSKRAQNFRRTVARDKNMARLLIPYSCLDTVLDMWAGIEQPPCDKLDDFWGTDNYNDMRLQLVNEAAWMSLAWGFLPSITGLLPKWPDDQGLDDFVDDYVRGPFGTNPPVGLSYTNIFKELHLAGWRPITNAVATDGSTPVNLVVERFGDQATLGGDQCVYFTVLNNDNLTTTMNDLVWPYDDGYPYCPDGYDCSMFPADGCPMDFFEARDKEFYLDIHEAYKFNLWDGNIECVQLVSNPANPSVCNWPTILAKQFSAGGGSTDYSIKRFPQLPYPNGKIRIGGTWPSMLSAPLKRTIEDKVLMVFKLWLSKTVDNGAGERGESEETTEGSEESADRVTGTYERYGQYWQTYDTAGYNGTVDAIRADSSGFALYKINVGRSGRHAVKIHFPTSPYGTALARYEAFVIDFQEEPIGEADLGSPVLTAEIDQSGRTTYSEFADGEGFITIGSIDVNVPESPGVVTVVIKLSIPEEERSRRSAESELLISDAVSLERID